MIYVKLHLFIFEMSWFSLSKHLEYSFFYFFRCSKNIVFIHSFPKFHKDEILHVDLFSFIVSDTLPIQKFHVLQLWEFLICLYYYDFENFLSSLLFILCRISIKWILVFSITSLIFLYFLLFFFQDILKTFVSTYPTDFLKIVVIKLLISNCLPCCLIFLQCPVLVLWLHLFWAYSSILGIVSFCFSFFYFIF